MSEPDLYLLGRAGPEEERLKRQIANLAPDSDQQLERLGIRPGERIIDLGCGPGGVLHLLGKRVGPTGSVLGIERDPHFVDLARHFVASHALAHPQLGLGLRLVAACWVLYLAYALWTTDSERSEGVVISVRQVFVTTLLNPKALIIALVLLPQTGLAAVSPWIAGYSLLVVGVGSTWIGAGAMLVQLSTNVSASHLPRRIAAVCLTLFSFGIAGSAIAAMH